MTTTRGRKARLEAVERGEWLSRMLADAPRRVARHPSPKATRRMRQRLAARMDRLAKAAA